MDTIPLHIHRAQNQVATQLKIGIGIIVPLELVAVIEEVIAQDRGKEMIALMTRKGK